MEFGPSETQRLFERVIRDYLGDRLPQEEVHRLGREGAGFDETLWRGLLELGLAGVLVPEGHGGAGLGMFEAALAAEALGYFAAPVPFAGPAVMAPRALRAAGDQAAEWLARIAGGGARIAVGFDGYGGATRESGVERSGARLGGRLTGVLDAGGATHVLAVLPDGTAGLLAIDGSRARAVPRPSLDRTRPLADLELDDAAVQILPGGEALAADVLDAGRVALAADTLGAAQRMLDRAVAYAREREQFGRPIGSFQAVKHMCAEMATMLEPCRALVWYAAYALDHLPDEARLAACHAKAHLGEVGREVARLATEVHGGMGFTDELGLHYWFKRIGASRQLLGGPERCRREAAARQGWAAPAPAEGGRRPPDEV
jgi:alkylation response protein AidB-like acyl-CoA dehydrogenase